MYLLDTNVLSEFRKPRPHGGVMAWVSQIPNNRLFISAVSISELQRGVELTRLNDANKATEIEIWIDRIVESSNVIDADDRIFRTYARLMQKRSGNLMEDALIAATAIVHDLTLATRNLRDFREFGVRTLNPFAP